MESLIKNVTVVGGTGELGTIIISALQESKLFHVSVLDSVESTYTISVSINVKKANLLSHTALVAALQDQDAVVCVFNESAVDVQFALINAALEAGVKRFIPDIRTISMVESHSSIVETLIQKQVTASVHFGKTFHYTMLNCGVPFDWALKSGFFDIALLPAKTTTIWDEGTNIFSTTTLSTIAEAIVAILSIAEEKTRDALVYVESFQVSQRSIIAALEGVTCKKWSTNITTTQEQLALVKTSMQRSGFLDVSDTFTKVRLLSGWEGCKFDKEKLSNKLLKLPKETLQGSVEDVMVALM